MTRKQTERAWLAGIIEGEGTIYSKKRARWATPCIRVAMTDADVLETITAITGLGRVTGPYERDEEWKKPIYHWQVHGDDAISVWQAVRPWIHGRRAQQAGASLGLQA